MKMIAAILTPSNKVEKFNENHDDHGRFAGSGGGGESGSGSGSVHAAARAANMAAAKAHDKYVYGSARAAMTGANAKAHAGRTPAAAGKVAALYARTAELSSKAAKEAKQSGDHHLHQLHSATASHAETMRNIFHEKSIGFK